MPSRTASTRWTGGLQDGSGQVSLDSSKVGTYDVSFPKRTSDESSSQTTPEELIAAAHTSCLAMSVAGVLDGEGLKADSIEVKAVVSLGPDPAGGFAITGIKMSVTASVPGVDDAKFQELAAKAGSGCPVSKALAGTKIELDATLA